MNLPVVKSATVKFIVFLRFRVYRSLFASKEVSEVGQCNWWMFSASPLGYFLFLLFSKLTDYKDCCP